MAYRLRHDCDGWNIARQLPPRQVIGLLDSPRAFPVDREVAGVAGELRRRYRQSHHNVGLPDYLIAATALVHGCSLATLNVKHFPMLDGLTPPFELEP